jgi:hypothetical protein
VRWAWSGVRLSGCSGGQGPPSSRVWRYNKLLFSAALKYFGNWQSAVQAAGLEGKPRRSWSAERVLGELEASHRQG